MAAKAHQRLIREREAERDARPAISGLDGCYVAPISKEEAESVILRYEWLGTMGRSVAKYGLVSAKDEIIGAAIFGWPGSHQSRNICGPDTIEQTICLERGACVHYAPKNAASFLISHATRLACREYGWNIFYAYADPEAGEIGTVYQACNWIYVGQGVGRTPGRMRQDWRLPNGDFLSSRSLRHRKLTPRMAKELGWVPVLKHPKHKYVHIEGDKFTRRRLLSSLRYEPQPYPKRQEN